MLGSPLTRGAFGDNMGAITCCGGPDGDARGDNKEDSRMTTINKQMSIGEVLEIDRTTAPIMMEYGMHCMGCPFSQMESLEMGCAAHGTDVDELVNRLNQYLAEKQ